jgi:hypothetical protein
MWEFGKTGTAVTYVNSAPERWGGAHRQQRADGFGEAFRRSGTSFTGNHSRVRIPTIQIGAMRNMPHCRLSRFGTRR